MPDEKPNEDVLAMARRIVNAYGGAEREMAHDAGADEVAAELLRIAALLSKGATQ